MVIAIAFVAVNAAYLVWCERKGAGLSSGGPAQPKMAHTACLQPPVDGIKLMTKQLLIPGGVDKILFLVAPVLAMIPAIICFVTIPFSETIVAHNMNYRC